MLYKQPKPKGFGNRKFVKAFIIFESVLAISSFILWSRLSRSQDFRFYMHCHFPTVLSVYYNLYEQVSGDKSLKQNDTMTWEED